jgi:hypothetical protein
MNGHPERAAKIEAAIQAAYPEHDVPAARLSDLLTDARHYADAHGLDFAASDRRAHADYLNELA